VLLRRGGRVDGLAWRGYEIRWPFIPANGGIACVVSETNKAHQSFRSTIKEGRGTQQTKDGDRRPNREDKAYCTYKTRRSGRVLCLKTCTGMIVRLLLGVERIGIARKKVSREPMAVN
jgi:hypothetical protein